VFGLNTTTTTTTSWINFTNVLRAAFLGADPKSAKRLTSHQCLFVLLGSSSIKAARKTLVKSTPTFHKFAKAFQEKRTLFLFPHFKTGLSNM